MPTGVSNGEADDEDEDAMVVDEEQSLSKTAAPVEIDADMNVRADALSGVADDGPSSPICSSSDEQPPPPTTPTPARRSQKPAATTKTKTASTKATQGRKPQVSLYVRWLWPCS
jgi:hypothetical protein